MADQGSELLAATAYGVTVALSVGEAALPGVLADLPHWWHDAPVTGAPDKSWTIGGDSSKVAAEAVVSELELWVAEHAVDRIFIHSGVVSIGGQALLLPGRSFAGKTTLTAALVRAGAVYGSDEYAPLRADGLVETYARPLWVRPIEGGDRRRVSAAALGGTTFTGAIPVGGVAMLRWDQAAGWDVAASTSGSAVLGMVDNCVPARSKPAAMLDALTAAMVGARSLQGTRGDADEAALRLIEWMTSA